jgi:hypothetical protein
MVVDDEDRHGAAFRFSVCRSHVLLVPPSRATGSSPATAFHAGLIAVAILAQIPESRAFCLYNLTPDADVHASLVPSQPGYAGKLYRDKVEPGKESCCNPKNTDCNPDRLPDAGLVAFEAKVVPRPPARPADLGCGAATRDPRNRARYAQAPLRGSLRFEPNPAFDRTRAEGPANPRYVLRILSAENAQVASYACVPG